MGNMRVHIGATWQVRLIMDSCLGGWNEAAAMWPYVRLF